MCCQYEWWKYSNTFFDDMFVFNQEKLIFFLK
jgi:hypothetical protein